jgi:hypothetical protein
MTKHFTHFHILDVTFFCTFLHVSYKIIGKFLQIFTFYQSSRSAFAHHHYKAGKKASRKDIVYFLKNIIQGPSSILPPKEY